VENYSTVCKDCPLKVQERYEKCFWVSSSAKGISLSTPLLGDIGKQCRWLMQEWTNESQDKDSPSTMYQRQRADEKVEVRATSCA
jgi:hypothetical protein